VINSIINFSARHRVLLLAAAVVGCAVGVWSLLESPLDAIPDVGDTQVIVSSRWDRSPDVIEDQLTYPMVSSLLGAPKVQSVRGYSDFGYSWVYVIFEEGTDMYWARSRTLEYLSSVLPSLPEGVKTELGPDATGLGWVFQYALVSSSGQQNLAELRSCQDFYLRYRLKAVQGVADVASLGGFDRQYQVNVDPNRLQTYRLPIGRVVEAVRAGNNDTGGGLLELGGREYMIRGHGYVRSVNDVENIVVAADENGTPLRVRDIGQVAPGPSLRRGVSDLDGEGEAVSGIVIMRKGENALKVIERVKAKLKEIAPGLPVGVKIVPVYDRSELIHRSIDNVERTLIEVLITVSLIVLLFLWHLPSAAIPIVTIPIVVLLSFIPFRAAGMTVNIMSMAGLALTFGALVDGAIVVVEQTHKQLEDWNRAGRPGRACDVILNAIRQVATPACFALAAMAISFIPVLTLQAEEGRMFRPLAYSMAMSLLIAAVLAITVDPALRLLVTRTEPFRLRSRVVSRIANRVIVGKFHSEERHPLNRLLMRIYEPSIRWALKRKWVVIAGFLGLLVFTLPVLSKLGAEFMPQVEEGSILYMPSTMPGISISEAQRLLQLSGRIIKQFPEVDHVLGKAGRAETSTDPAPLSMLETIITLRPKAEWRGKETWYSAWSPRWLKSVLRRFTPDRISYRELVAEMDAALQIPGVTNAWTMPVRGRLDMLTTGIRTPLGIKVSGTDTQVIEKIGTQIEALLSRIPGTRGVFAERANSGGYFLDFDWDREKLARYGISMLEAQGVIANAVGGETVTTTIENRERHSVNVRYLRDYRSDLGALERVLVPIWGGKAHVPVSELANIRMTEGPSMIRDENGLLTGYVYIDIGERAPAGYVEQADRLIHERLKLPVGVSISWSGQYEAIQRARHRLKVIVPLTLLAIVMIIYWSTRSVEKTLIISLAVPFSAIGAVWCLYLLGYHLSVAVWIGIIALLGVDAQTGTFMLLYLDLSHQAAKREGRLRDCGELREAVVRGAAKRVRPKFMTFAATCIGLLPILWSTGAGSEIMKRIAAPMVGGIVTSFLLELILYPVIYELWRSSRVKHPSHRAAGLETVAFVPDLD
jgi:Cu(I)/Ag(I) efflux system membrane protein CusA/SilA